MYFRHFSTTAIMAVPKIAIILSLHCIFKYHVLVIVNYNFLFTTEDKRALTEPPIPGYRGYVPRIGQTELGLGNRYNTTTRLGFEAFYAQQQANRSSEPLSITR